VPTLPAPVPDLIRARYRHAGRVGEPLAVMRYSIEPAEKFRPMSMQPFMGHGQRHVVDPDDTVLHRVSRTRRDRQVGQRLCGHVGFGRPRHPNMPGLRFERYRSSGPRRVADDCLDRRSIEELTQECRGRTFLGNGLKEQSDMTVQSDEFTGLRALFINCTLKRSPELSHTQGLIDISTGIMEKHGVAVEVVRAVDHDIATGVWPDMREHGWATDDWPMIFEKVLASDILVLAGPIWLGDNSSVMKRVHERLYGGSHLLNDAGQYLYYGRVGGCLITGNEDGVKHCAQNVLYTLQHIGYTIPPQADAGWIGEAGPGPSYLDPGSGGPQNDFTNRNTTFMTWNLMHLARMLRAAGGIPAYGNLRSGWDAGCRYDFDNPDYR